MTYRERREARIERLREWAEKREQKSDAAHGAAFNIIENIPAGQPILVGHHSERRHRQDLARHDRYMSQSIEHSNKADQMRERANNIEDALDRAIYDDDPDATERLQEKLNILEAKRNHLKAANIKARGHNGLTEEDLATIPSDVLEVIKSYQQFGGGTLTHPIPGYAFSNLNGNINRTRKRLARLQQRAAIQ